MHYFLYLQAITTILTCYNTQAVSDNDFVPGVVANQVYMLHRDNFKKAIEDPANPVWFLKFYAPWCGHCKKMAPILDSVAPKVSGMIAIGKIDCTIDQKFCQDYQVRGYPTLKFSLDGIVHDYPGGRTENDIITFATKINRPDVQIVTSIQDAIQYTPHDDDIGVAFVAYHPKLIGDKLDTKLASTVPTQVYAQVARHLKASGHFLLLDSSPDNTDDTSSSSSLIESIKSIGQDTDKPFVCRIERHVPVRCFDSTKFYETGFNKAVLLEYVVSANVPTVVNFGPSNFNKIGRKGRPLVIAVVSNSNAIDEINTVKQILADYAINGPDTIRDLYYYGWIDGKMFYKFLEQFEINKDTITPQIFVLDFPKKRYWKGASYQLNIKDLLNDINTGKLVFDTAGKKGFDGYVERAIDKFMDYMPYSVMGVVAIFAVVIVSILACITPGDDLRPPYVTNKNNNLSAAASSSVPIQPPTTNPLSSSSSTTTEPVEAKKEK